MLERRLAKLQEQLKTERARHNRQVAAVKRLIRVLKGDYKIVTANIVKHSDVRDGGTECPGKHFPMNEVIAAGDRNLVEARP